MKPAAIVFAALFLLATGCGREPAPPSPRAAASRAGSNPAAWFEVVVEPAPGWDAAFVARRTGAELAMCREIIERRLGLPEPDSRCVVRVACVHDAATVQAQRDAIPAAEPVHWCGASFLQPAASRLVLGRDAEVRERTYMMIVALLLVHFRVEPVRFVDSCALWLCGLALNQVDGSPVAGRGRVPTGIRYALHGEFGPREIEGACAWGLGPIGTTASLSWGAPGADPEFSDIDAIDRPRTRAWWIVYFLATFDVDEDGRVRFDRTPKYDRMLRQLLGRPGSAGREAPRLAGDSAIVAELVAYRQFVLRKLGLGHLRMGALLAWDEKVNRVGTKTGEPDDDLLRP